MRHAIRRLISSPSFSLTAAITLAAAIGANALIFSVVNGVLLKPLPFERPETLVGLWHVAPGILPGPVNQAPSTYFLYREQGQAFEDIGLWDNTSVTLTGRGEPEEVEGLVVTDGTLPILGVSTVVGRRFTKEDDAPGSRDALDLTLALADDHGRRAPTASASCSSIARATSSGGRSPSTSSTIPASR